jgi:hypothetical protein
MLHRTTTKWASLMNKKSGHSFPIKFCTTYYSTVQYNSASNLVISSIKENMSRINHLLRLAALALVLLSFSSTTTTTTAFCPSTPYSKTVVVSRRNNNNNNHHHSNAVSQAPPSLNRSFTQLFERKKGEYKGTNDGTGRGLIFQAFVLGICIWLFTVPPEFRRTYFCPADIYCQEEGSCQRECVTYDQFFQNVGDYYKNGGGIQWDFSIDPKTKQVNQEKLDSIFQK